MLMCKGPSVQLLDDDDYPCALQQVAVTNTSNRRWIYTGRVTRALWREQWLNGWY